MPRETKTNSTDKTNSNSPVVRAEAGLADSARRRIAASRAFEAVVRRK